MNTQLVCDGVISINSLNQHICDGQWLSQIASVPFDLTSIDPIVSTAFFGAGFALPIVPWAASIGIKYMFSLIR